MIKKLQFKFIAISMLSVFLVLLVIIGSINVMNYRRIVRDSEKVLSVLAENNGEFPGRHELLNDYGVKDRKKLRFDDLRGFGDELSPEMPYESRYFTVQLNSNGEAVLVDTGKIAAIDSETAIEYAENLWSRKSDSGFISNYRYLRQYNPGGMMIIFLDCRKNLSSFRSFLFYSLICSLAGMIAFAVLVLLLSRMVMKPVQESYDKQKSFVIDAGHEIKTPLTIIDADAAILEMECGEDNEWISDIRAQTRRLTSLTKDLIYLSRMEEEQNRVQMIDFPLSDVLTETAQSFQSLAKVQNKTFNVDIQPMMNLCGDEKAITQLVSILLDNALKYSDHEGIISLKARQRGRGVYIEVFNTAESVETEKLSRLFDRFYRADKSRNSETGGYGIGLSIAKAITEAHKGKITAASADGRSLTITVVLP